MTTIIHSAASVSFTLPLDEARAINLDGTRRMLDFAELARERGGLDRYGHVSTAYVAGDHTGAFLRARSRSSARRFTTPTSSRSSRPSSSSARTPSCRTRSCVRASSSATAAAAGRQPSTSSTGRCGRSRAGCSRPCRRSPPPRSTSSRSTTSPTPIHALCESGGGIGATYHLTAGAARLDDRRDRRPGQPLLPPPAARGCCRPAEFAALPPCERGPAVGDRGSSARTSRTSRSARCSSEATRARLEPAGIRAYTAGRIHRAPAGLRHAQPLGQAPDHARPSVRVLGPVRGSGTVGVLGPVRVSGPSASLGRRAPHVGGRARRRFAAARVEGRDWPIALLVDIARFRPDDPDALVHASLACPMCLRSDDVEWAGSASRVTIHRSYAAAPLAHRRGACTWRPTRRCDWA